MKKHLYLLVSILVLTIVQARSQNIPAKSNAIIITLPDSNGVIDKAAKAFTERDHTINPVGKNPNLLITAARTLKNGTRVSYTAEAKGTDIILMGKIMVAGQSNMVIAYQGNKGSPFMNGWEEMEKIAKALGGKVRYETR